MYTPCRNNLFLPHDEETTVSPSPPPCHPALRLRRNLFLPHDEEITASPPLRRILFPPHDEETRFDDDDGSSEEVITRFDDDDDDGSSEEVITRFDDDDDDDDDGGLSEEVIARFDDDGLSEGVIARFLKTKTLCEKETVAVDGVDIKQCAVCQDDLYREHRTVGILRCHHHFHAACIGKWLRIKNSCPLCRDIAINIIY